MLPEVSTSRPRPGRFLGFGGAMMAVVGLLTAVLASPGHAAVAPADSSRALQTALRRQLATSQLDSALATARTYQRLHPNDPSILYNLAGLEEHAGRRDAAVEAMGAAVAAGFDEFRFADADSDLGALREDPRYQQLRERAQRALQERRAGHVIPVTAGVFSDPIALDDRGGGMTPPLVSVRLRPTATMVEIEATVQEPHPDDELPPWRGGSGLLVTFVLPADSTTGEGTVFREVAAGLQNKLPAGALLVDLPRAWWQRITELTPKLKFDPRTQRLVYDVQIPWAAVAPLQPLARRDLGIDITYVAHDAEGQPTYASLLRDPATGRLDRPWRRSLPLQVSWPASTGPAVCGWLPDPVLRDSLLTGTAALVAPQAGHAEITTLVRAGRDTTGAIAAQRVEPIEVTAGWQSLPLRVVAPNLAAGAATLDVQVALPGGKSARWQHDLAVIPSAWLPSVRRAAADLPTAEITSLTYRIDAIAAALATRKPTDAAGPLATMVAQVAGLLARARATGTTMPDSGSYLAVLPARGDAPLRPCTVAMPAGFRQNPQRRVLLVIGHWPGQEARLADLALRLLAQKAPSLQIPASTVAVVVPHALSMQPPAPGDAAAMVAQACDWVHATFGSRPVYLAGCDLLAAATLRAAVAHPLGAEAVLMVVGPDFRPWPQDDAATLPTRLAGVPADLPFAWIRFADDASPGDQSQAVIDAMRSAGLTVASVAEVPGGLSLSQVSGRAMLWAASAD